MENLSERIRFILYKHSISQSEAARRCGISQQSMNYIIKNNLTSSKLSHQIAEGLNVNAEWLINGLGNPEQRKMIEIPFFDNPLGLKAFLSGIPDLIKNHICIDIDYGELAFAYMIDEYNIVICSHDKKTFLKTNHMEFIQINSDEVKISKTKIKNSFQICEWRIKNVIV